MAGKKKIRRKCAVEGCGKDARTREWCVAHYQRWLRHGDPLAGGPSIPWGEAQSFYRDKVIPYTGNSCLIWPFVKRDSLHARIWHQGRMEYVSRLICEEENGPPPSPLHQAAHNCGNAQCVARKHIRWATPVENNADKIEHGTLLRGEAVASSKLTDADVIQIIRMKGVCTVQEIKDRFGISHSHINRIHNGKAWSWLNSGEIA